MRLQVEEVQQHKALSWSLHGSLYDSRWFILCRWNPKAELKAGVELESTRATRGTLGNVCSTSQLSAKQLPVLAPHN